MNDLKKQIKQLEADIFLENLYIEEIQQSLTEKANAPKFLSLAIFGTFLFSFFMSRKKTLPQAIKTLASLSLVARKWYQKIKNILPLLPL